MAEIIFYSCEFCPGGTGTPCKLKGKLPSGAELRGGKRICKQPTSNNPDRIDCDRKKLHGESIDIGAGVLEML